MEANRRHLDPIETVLEAERGKRLVAGKIVEVERRTTEGFLRGCIGTSIKRYTGL